MNTDIELKEKIKADNKVELTGRELKYFRDEDGIKGMFRYVLATDIIKAKLKEEGKGIPEFVINLAVELIVSSNK